MQSGVVEIFVLGDLHATKSYLDRLVFGEDGEAHSLSKKDNVVDDSSFPHNTHTSSYLLDNKRCYTLQFWEVHNDDDIESLEALQCPKPDIFVMIFDISKRSSFKNMASLHQQMRLNILNAPLLVIAARLDLLNQTDGLDQDESVPISEVQEMVKSLGTLCVQCCPVTGEGVQEAAHFMVNLAVNGQKQRKKRRYLFFKKKLHTRPTLFFPSGLVIDPSGNYGMENAPRCPGVNVLASTCVEDLARMKDDVTCRDVRFTFPDCPMSPIEAHQVILISAAPELFQDIFTGTAKSQVSGRLNELFEKVSWPVNHDQNAVLVQRMVEICVCDKVPRHEFARLVEFLYVGASIADLRKSDSIHELLAIAKTFHLTELFEACENVLEDNEMENAMKPSFVGGGKATVLKDLFFDKPLLDDLVFQVQGVLIYAHQAVITARSRALANKISDYRRDHPGCVRVKVEIDDVSVETFKSLLEYLYTDDVNKSLKQEALLEVLGLATAYQLPRLVSLCEYKLIVSFNEDSKQESVLEIFLVAKKHNAQQLEKWCRSLIARNYVHFNTCVQYELLSTKDKDYIERHRWPPKCDLSEENSLSLNQYLADRQVLDEGTTTCCGLGYCKLL